MSTATFCTDFLLEPASNSMATELQIPFLIHGYIRMKEIEYKLAYIIPIGIIKLMIVYFPRKFIFISRDSDYEIIDNGLTLKSLINSKYNIVQFGEFFCSSLKYPFIWIIKSKFISGNISFDVSCCRWIYCNI